MEEQGDGPGPPDAIYIKDGSKGSAWPDPLDVETLNEQLSDFHACSRCFELSVTITGLKNHLKRAHSVLSMQSHACSERLPSSRTT